MRFELKPLGRNVFCVVSEEDADLAVFPWRTNHPARSNSPYVIRYWRAGGRKKLFEYLHRVVAQRMGHDVTGMVVDHINGDSLDNRRENLRVVTVSENVRNTRGPYKHTKSGTPGVHATPQGTWAAGISVNGRWRYLGRRKTKEEAIALRLGAERELWGVQPRRAWEHK